MAKQKWGIEARAFPIPYTPFNHNFWVLADADKHVCDQLHGLAVDPKTGLVKAIGNSIHHLQVIHRADVLWALHPGQPTAVCAIGSEAEIRERWQAAVRAVAAINVLQLSYPAWWQHGYKINSNSVFATLGHIMGFPEPQRILPVLSPGTKLVVSREIIAQYCYQQRVMPPAEFHTFPPC